MKKNKDTIGIVFNKAWDKSRSIALKQVLPTDTEVNDWFDNNIDSGCSASSAIFKFRIWLKDRSKNINPHHTLAIKRDYGNKS